MNHNEEMNRCKNNLIECYKSLETACDKAGGVMPSLDITLREFINTYGWNGVSFTNLPKEKSIKFDIFKMLQPRSTRYLNMSTMLYDYGTHRQSGRTTTLMEIYRRSSLYDPKDLQAYFGAKYMLFGTMYDGGKMTSIDNMCSTYFLGKDIFRDTNTVHLILDNTTMSEVYKIIEIIGPLKLGKELIIFASFR